MFNLDPGKLLVIAVVAIILLGPDKLPQVARQAGNAWRSFNEFRHRMEAEVRNTIPDLPPTSEIARLARSPSALLNHLSNLSPDEEPDGSFRPPVAEGESAEDLTVPAGPAPTAAPGPPDAPAQPAAPNPPEATPPRGAESTPAAPPRPPEAIVPGDPSLN